MDKRWFLVASDALIGITFWWRSGTTPDIWMCIAQAGLFLAFYWLGAIAENRSKQ